MNTFARLPRRTWNARWAIAINCTWRSGGIPRNSVDRPGVIELSRWENPCKPSVTTPLSR